MGLLREATKLRAALERGYPQEVAERLATGDLSADDDLLFIHNTSADKLRRQIGMGGLPNPSIAVTQEDIPFSGFGDISLIGRPESFDPRQRRNVLYSADAYTERAPSPIRIAKKDSYKTLRADYEALRELEDAPFRAHGVDDQIYRLANSETKSKADPSDYRNVSDFLQFDNQATAKFALDTGKATLEKLSAVSDRELRDFKDKNKDEFNAWKKEQLDRYYEDEEFFLTNPDYDRYSGRARLKPYTAENVSRFMTKQGGVNAESTLSFGAGNVRASTVERIKSLPEAKKRKGLLQMGEKIAEMKEETDSMLTDLQEDLRPFYKYEASGFRYLDEVGEMIAMSEKMGMDRALKEVGFEDVPDQLIEDIKNYKDYLRTAPTEYFESKPQRPVQLDEFAGAIVPQDTPQGILDMLQDAGLRVEQYSGGAEIDPDEARTLARKAFKDQMFDMSPVVAATINAGQGLLANPQQVDGLGDPQANLQQGLMQAAVQAHNEKVAAQKRELGVDYDPRYDYGMILPYKKDIVSGETSLAFPQIARGILGALIDLGNTPRTGVYNPNAILDVAL